KSHSCHMIFLLFFHPFFMLASKPLRNANLINYTIYTADLSPFEIYYQTLTIVFRWPFQSDRRNGLRGASERTIYDAEFV
ncbi:hypothetical protein F5Y06DRAFT_276620, partial [Hypoxylon sp. FL0890]